MLVTEDFMELVRNTESYSDFIEKGKPISLAKIHREIYGKALVEGIAKGIKRARGKDVIHFKKLDKTKGF